MPGAAIRLDLDERPALRSLQRLAGALADPSAVLDQIGQRLMTSTDRRFETETAPDGTAWKPSRPSYERGPAKGGMGHSDRGQTLTETSRLRKSITRRITGRELMVGTNVVYAAIHQFGGRTPPRTIRPRHKKALFWPGAAHPVASVKHPGAKIPARPFLGLSAGDEAAIERIVARAIGRAVGGGA